MAKYILNCHEDLDNSLGANITYEFNANHIDDVRYHLVQFLRSSGFTWVDEIKITTHSKIDLGEIELNQVYNLDDSEKY